MGKSSFWNVEKLLGITAILVSIGTLIIIVYQTNLMRKQQYAAVLPYLEVWNSNPNSSTYRLLLLNNGVGPAFIDGIKVLYKDTVHIGDPATFYKNIVYPSDTINFGYSNLNKGRLVPAGREVELVSCTNSEINADKLRKLFGSEKAKVQITYSSIYGEQWQINGLMDPPIKIK